jgi:hypothetical protein
MYEDVLSGISSGTTSTIGVGGCENIGKDQAILT